MLTRRAASSLLATIATAPVWAGASPTSVAFYNAVGPTLTCWQVDTGAAALTKQGSVTLPGLVQYAWRNPAKPVLYVASSNFVPMGDPGGKHHLTAFHIDPTGALSPFGAPVAIRARPINISVDAKGAWLLTAYNVPRYDVGASAWPGRRDRRGSETGRAHRRRHLRASGPHVAVQQGTRAGHPRQQRDPAKPEDPGALKVKALKNGQLSDIASIAPRAGYGFGPRHLDPHPSKPWMYVSIERQNQLQMYRLHGDGMDPARRFRAHHAERAWQSQPEQMVGPIHVHPNGRFVYLGNRASGMVEAQGRKVAAGGENSVAVFSIDPASGEPRMAQTIDTRGYHPRTFSIDPGGKMLVVANLMAMPVRDGDSVRTQPATLSATGSATMAKLTFVRSYDIETNGMTQWWSGFIRT